MLYQCSVVQCWWFTGSDSDKCDNDDDWDSGNVSNSKLISATEKIAEIPRVVAKQYGQGNACDLQWVILKKFTVLVLMSIFCNFCQWSGSENVELAVSDLQCPWSIVKSGWMVSYESKC